MSSKMTDHMLFLTYTPRADSVVRGYHAWLRSTDTPFFNTVPGIAHYANWQVVGAADNSGVPWDYFDFLHIEKGKTPDDIWGNERLARFAAGWSVHWAKEPDAPDMSVNYQVHEATCKRKIDGGLTDFAAIVLDPDHDKLPDGAALWEIKTALLGSAVEGEFAVVNLPACRHTADPSWGKKVLLSECIAKPDKYVTLE